MTFGSRFTSRSFRSRILPVGSLVSGGLTFTDSKSGGWETGGWKGARRDDSSSSKCKSVSIVKNPREKYPVHDRKTRGFMSGRRPTLVPTFVHCETIRPGQVFNWAGTQSTAKNATTVVVDNEEDLQSESNACDKIR